jgi:hypothetical protein
MKRLIACIAAMLMALALSVVFAPPASAVINPSDGQDYSGYNIGTPTSQIGSDADKAIGVKFTVNAAGTIAGSSFYKKSADNNQGYARWSMLYKKHPTTGQYYIVRQGWDALEYANSPYLAGEGWRHMWYQTPLNVVAGEEFIISTNSRYGWTGWNGNAFVPPTTFSANGLTATGTTYAYGNTSGGQGYPIPLNATNSKYGIDLLFKQSAPPAPTYPNHTNIVATTFWVGEVFNSQLTDGSQVCSAYDGEWAKRWSANEPVIGNAPAGTDCEGSPVGGCDGVYGGTTVATFTCETQIRTSANNYFPTGPNTQTPAENPFYLDLPYDDVLDPVAFAERCSVIPWAAAVNAQLGNKCTDQNFSYMKNRWVKFTNGSNVCYGQVQDAGPSTGTNYHDKAYVFGANDARPLNQEYSGDPTQGAGADISPALVGCLGFTNINGDTNHVNWQFVERSQVPNGPWTIIETTSGFNWS